MDWMPYSPPKSGPMLLIPTRNCEGQIVALHQKPHVPDSGKGSRKGRKVHVDQQRKVFQFAQPRDSFILLLWNRACLAWDWFSQTWPESPCAHTLKGLSRRWQVRVETVGRLAEAHCRNVQYKRRLRAKIRVRLRSKARSQGLRVCAPVGGSPPQQYMRHSQVIFLGMNRQSCFWRHSSFGSSQQDPPFPMLAPM